MKQTLRQQYERFKLQWMVDHGYTLTDFVKILDEIAEESADNESVFEYYDAFESDIGFNGELYPSFYEWFNNERKDNEIQI